MASMDVGMVAATQAKTSKAIGKRSSPYMGTEPINIQTMARAGTNMLIWYRVTSSFF